MSSFETEKYIFNITQDKFTISTIDGLTQDYFKLDRINFVKYSGIEENPYALIGMLTILFGLVGGLYGNRENIMILQTVGIFLFIIGIILSVLQRKESRLIIQVSDTIYEYELKTGVDDLKELVDGLL